MSDRPSPADRCSCGGTFENRGVESPTDTRPVYVCNLCSQKADGANEPATHEFICDQNPHPAEIPCPRCCLRRPSPADLAEAERYFRRLAISWEQHGARSDAAQLTVLMANYSRLQRIEQAAAALARHEHWIGLEYDPRAEALSDWKNRREQLVTNVILAFNATPPLPPVEVPQPAGQDENTNGA